MSAPPDGYTAEQWATLAEAAEGIVDGWYPEGRIDWDDFLDRLETQTGIDLGGNLLAPVVVAVKKHVNAYRKAVK